MPPHIVAGLSLGYVLPTKHKVIKNGETKTLAGLLPDT